MGRPCLRSASVAFVSFTIAHLAHAQSLDPAAQPSVVDRLSTWLPAQPLASDSPWFPETKPRESSPARGPSSNEVPPEEPAPTQPARKTDVELGLRAGYAVPIG